MWLALLLLLLLAPGCLVRVYHPMSGFQRPVVTDPRHPNFADTEIALHCVPGDALTESQAGVLCQKVQTLFENQGAVVRTHLSAGVVADELQDDEPPPVDDGEAAPAEVVPRLALTVQLRTRKVYESSHALSWILCLGSFTVLPGTFETTFAQDVVVRDGTGFLLLDDRLEVRLVTRFGFGSWLGNFLLDIQRPKEERILNETVRRHLSEDLYRQLTQMVFNAKMHAEVLHEASLRAGP